jgi:hypothetical protein
VNGDSVTIKPKRKDVGILEYEAKLLRKEFKEG